MLKSVWIEENDQDEMNDLDYMLQTRERLAKITDCVQENLSKALSKDKRHYNKSAHSRSFDPGEQVLLLLSTSPRKLQAPWQGPFTVIRRVGPIDYEIERLRRQKKNNIFHINMLKLWRDNERSVRMALLAEGKEDEEDTASISGGQGLFQLSDITINPELDAEQQRKMTDLLAEF